MATEAQRFFEDHVVPAVRDWENNELELHRASLVAANLSHMADHFWHSHSSNSQKVLGARSLKEFREVLSSTSADYALIRDVSDAHKHCKLERASRQITNSSQTTKGSMSWGEAAWGEGRYGGPEEIVVTDDKGQKHHFSSLVRRTMQLWRQML